MFIYQASPKLVLAMDEPQQGGETQQLGGNIELAGFQKLDGGTMIVLKKIIGNYARKFSDKLNGIDKLSLKVQQAGEQYELHCRLVAGNKNITVSHSDHNLFFLVDQALKKVEDGLGQEFSSTHS